MISFLRKLATESYNQHGYLRPSFFKKRYKTCKNMLVTNKLTQTRRKFVRAGLILVSIFGFGGFFYSCRSPKKGSATDPCKDLSTLSETDLSTRQQLGYIDQSSFSDRNCMNCNLYLKSDETLPCGSCLVIKGPIDDSGYCTVWAPLEA